MENVEQVLRNTGVIPVIQLEDEMKAVPLGQALLDGGIPAAEVTFRTPAAAKSIEKIAAALPEMFVCAGTVLSVEQAKLAVDCGAKAVISPGTNREVVEWCLKNQVPVYPGCATPTEVEAALGLGLTTVKLFPAEVVGGVKMLKALYGPYRGVKFMPTGGVNAKNLTSYLDFPKIIACGGSWMVPGDLINAGEWDKIEQLTREAVQTMLGFELAHIGINAENAEEAESIAKLFEAAFGFGAKVGNSSVFAGTAVEVMKTPYLGKNGHIAIATNYLSRAIAYLKSKGYEFDEDTCKYDAKGNMTAIYFKQDFGGFAVHLVQKK